MSYDLTPYNTGELGKIPEDISVQIQADLSKLEGLIVYFLTDILGRSNEPMNWFLEEHFHNLDAASKLGLFNQMVLAAWKERPELEDQFSRDARKRSKRNMMRMLEIRNTLSHCLHAKIEDNDVVVTHRPRGGITETRLAFDELNKFVGDSFMDIGDDLKYLASQIYSLVGGIPELEPNRHVNK